MKTTAKTGNVGINIGSTKEAVVEARGAINDILKSSADQKTKVAALTVLSDLCSVKNCTFNNLSVGSV